MSLSKITIFSLQYFKDNFMNGAMWRPHSFVTLSLLVFNCLEGNIPDVLNPYLWDNLHTVPSTDANSEDNERQMADPKRRMATFLTWPRENTVSSEHLCAAGFYYTGSCIMLVPVEYRVLASLCSPAICCLNVLFISLCHATNQITTLKCSIYNMYLYISEN